MSVSHLTLRRTFVADHFHDVPGFVEARHGHNWEIEASVLLEDLASEAAFVQSLDAWVEKADYCLLNEQACLEKHNPTTELIAAWIFRDLEREGHSVQRVRVREKSNYWAACSRKTTW